MILKLCLFLHLRYLPILHLDCGSSYIFDKLGNFLRCPTMGSCWDPEHVGFISLYIRCGRILKYFLTSWASLSSKTHSCFTEGNRICRKESLKTINAISHLLSDIPVKWVWMLFEFPPRSLWWAPSPGLSPWYDPVKTPSDARFVVDGPTRQPWVWPESPRPTRPPTPRTLLLTPMSSWAFHPCPTLQNFRINGSLPHHHKHQLVIKRELIQHYYGCIDRF